ncbi:hypothetical protein [Flexithrix dorotheae]|uniref:hypothetical protein n=1 Tax=Flexithrix dorotheae TaxID=70993 RepID=UPI00037AF19B|nr:hypothetical protein [Flexithrix dorotheae]
MDIQLHQETEAMDTTSILEEPKVLIEQGDNPPFLSIKWKGKPEFPEFKFAYEHFLFFAENQNVHHLILDHIELEKNSIKAKTWFLISFIPRLVGALKFNLKVAIMVPETKYVDSKQKIIISTFRNLSRSLKIKAFETKEDAYEWFKEVSGEPEKIEQ